MYCSVFTLPVLGSKILNHILITCAMQQSRIAMRLKNGVWYCVWKVLLTWFHCMIVTFNVSLVWYNVFFSKSRWNMNHKKLTQICYSTLLCLTIGPTLMYMEFSLATKFFINPNDSIVMYGVFHNIQVYGFVWVATTHWCYVNIYYTPKIFACVYFSSDNTLIPYAVICIYSGYLLDVILHSWWLYRRRLS